MWHRRAGKDDFALHRTACQAFQTVGTYWHMLPKANQARKAVWDAINPHTGKRRIDEAFPPELRENTKDQEMMIRFVNGSTWQLAGSDNYNALVGSPPVGVTFSEYALADPSAWAYLRPILAENGGTAMFISTPRGRNHLAKMYEYAAAHPDEWFCQRLTVDDTRSIPSAIIDRERTELRAERGVKEADAIIEQEYFCSFDAAIPGSYYGEHMSELETSGRIGDYPWIENKPVVTSWDIGYGDSTAIWFGQWTGTRWRLIDYLEGSGVGADWYAKKIAEKPYRYDLAVLPHDAGSGSVQTGKSFSQVLRENGVQNRVLPRAEDIETGIQAVRSLLRSAEFNDSPTPGMGEDRQAAKMRMQRGLDTLRSYRRKWNEANQSFADAPLHDWASNGADSMRYFAVGAKPPQDLQQQSPVTMKQDWAVY